MNFKGILDGDLGIFFNEEEFGEKITFSGLEVRAVLIKKEDVEDSSEMDRVLLKNLLTIQIPTKDLVEEVLQGDIVRIEESSFGDGKYSCEKVREVDLVTELVLEEVEDRGC